MSKHLVKMKYAQEHSPLHQMDYSIEIKGLVQQFWKAEK